MLCVGCSGHYTDHKCHTTNLDTIMVKESTVHCTLGRETQHFSFWLCVLKREHCEVESGFVDVVDVSAEQTAVTCVCGGGGPGCAVVSCLGIFIDLCDISGSNNSIYSLLRVHSTVTTPNL